MEDLAISIKNITKEYRLGAIGGTTFREDFHRWLKRCKNKYNKNNDLIQDKSDKFLALNDISFDVKKGERIGIIGHNGAGKSTLLKLLSRITTPTSGSISYNGKISSMLEVGTGFHGELTGRENIYMNGAILGMSKREIDSKIDDIIAFTEMEQFIDTPVKRFSSGMYVKLAFAVAAHLDNDILVMDEVLAVGDMKFQQKCLGKMSDASKQDHKTVLYVSHNMNTIRQLCDRCIVLDHGTLIFDGDVEEAIGIYIQNADNKLEQYKSYIEASRDMVCEEDLTIQSVLMNNDQCTIKFNNPLINIDVNFLTLKEIDDMFLRITVIDDTQTSIGIFDSNKISFSKKGNCAINITLNIDDLLPGRYGLKFVAYRTYMKKVELLDIPNQIFYFLKEENINLLNTEYNKRKHGHIYFGKMGIEIKK